MSKSIELATLALIVLSCSYAAYHVCLSPICMWGKCVIIALIASIVVVSAISVMHEVKSLNNK